MIEIDGLFFPDLMDDLYGPLPGTFEWNTMVIRREINSIMLTILKQIPILRGLFE